MNARHGINWMGHSPRPGEPVGRGVNWASATVAAPRGVNWMSALPRAGLGAAVAVFLAAVMTLGFVAPQWNAAARAANGPESVIVQAVQGAATQVAREISGLGGTIDRKLGIINGFEARVPRRALSQLRAAPGVRGVTRNNNVRLMTLLGDYSATGRGDSMYNVTLGTGAQSMWQAGFTGRGVGVALLDSGTVPVQGLTAGNVVRPPSADLSLDATDPNAPSGYDAFGHGTHMAGIIAGRDGTATGSYAGDSSDFLGMAPDANVISIKAADSIGLTDESTLIAGIGWAVAHQAQYNIRVLNLSAGVPVIQNYKLDPLAYAVEQAWASGIVVVAAAGNDGNAHKGPGNGLTDPAYDPNILAVGAADTQATLTQKDDTVASFSSTQGSGALYGRHPDVVAPGQSIESLRDPGSYIDQTYGSTGTVDARIFKGSGSSQATAVVSGAAALILSEYPNATPDQVKALLVQNADKLKGYGEAQAGKGEVDLSSVLAATVGDKGNLKPLPKVPPAHLDAIGGGSLGGPAPLPGAKDPKHGSGSTLSTDGPGGTVGTDATGGTVGTDASSCTAPATAGTTGTSAGSTAPATTTSAATVGSGTTDVSSGSTASATTASATTDPTSGSTASTTDASSLGSGSVTGTSTAATPNTVTDPSSTTDSSATGTTTGTSSSGATTAPSGTSSSGATTASGGTTAPSGATASTTCSTTTATDTSGDTSGHTWSGHTWSTTDWSGHTWSGHTWSGHTWSAVGWLGHTWSGHTWSGHTWSDDAWTVSSWASSDWS